MKILSLGGIPINHDLVTNQAFSSDVSLLDYDVVIWNPSSLHTEYPKVSYREGQHLRNCDIVHDCRRRLYELMKFRKLGRPFVLLLPSKWSYRIDNSAGILTTREEIFRIYDYLPFDGLEPFSANGNSIQLRGGEPFKSYWERMGRYHSYVAYLEAKVGDPFLFVKGTDNIVGTYVQHENGFSLILPQFVNLGSFKEKSEMCDTFIESLIDLIKSLKQLETSDPLPDWVNLYSLPGENEQRGKLGQLIDEKEKITEQIQIQENEIFKYAKKKVLIGGTGKELERQVTDIFRELGCKVIPGQNNRDDLQIEYVGTVAEIEVKGVSKSAAEGHARQVNTWVDDYFIKTQDYCKGILIVNAFCHTPLNQRSEPAFPNAVIDFSIKRDICLMTTTQLLGLYYCCISNPKERDQLVRELFDTVGEYQKFKNYGDFISAEELHL